MEPQEWQDWRSRPGFLPLFLGLAAVGGAVGGWGFRPWLAGGICLLLAALLFALSWHLYDRRRFRRRRPRHRL